MTTQPFPKLILISENPQDRRLFPFVAKSLASECIIVEDLRALIDALDKNRDAIVIWDGTSKEGADEKNRFFAPSVLKVIDRLAMPGRVVSVSPRPLDAKGAIKKAKYLFRNFFTRSDSEFAVPAYSKALAVLVSSSNFQLEHLFRGEATVGNVKINRSDAKQAVSLASEKLVTSIGVDPRVASRLARAVDELVMNAIFDAPRDVQGVPFRRRLDRKATFAFEPGEVVHVGFAKGQEISAIGVTDKWGSIDFTEVLRFLIQDFESEIYEASKYEPGAGLGLYGIVKSGASLAFKCVPNSGTMGIVFFANAQENKVHKSAFQFLVLAGD